MASKYVNILHEADVLFFSPISGQREVHNSAFGHEATANNDVNVDGQEKVGTIDKEPTCSCYVEFTYEQNDSYEIISS